MFIRLLNVCKIVSFSLLLASISKELIKSISLFNQTGQARPTLVDVNSNETLFYPLSINENASNSKQKWNHDECWCECKELDDWGSIKDCYM